MFKQFESYPQVQLLCTTSQGGVSEGAYSSLNLATHTGDNSAHVAENRLRISKQLGINSDCIVLGEQTHTTNVKKVTEQSIFPNTDALITNVKGLFIGVLTADCVPLVLFDPVKNATGVIHAGWKGLVGGIISNTFDLMQKEYGSKAKDLIVYIGPSISQKNYEVGKDVIEAFSSLFPPKFIFKDWNNDKSKAKLDLWKCSVLELVSLGVKQENIELEGICTFESEDYFSARKLGLKSGRFMTGAILR